MTETSPETSAVPEGAAADAQQAFQDWQTGNQPAAIARIRERADRGEPWAVGFVAWLYMQQGVPGLLDAAEYAKRAHSLGMPWPVVHVFNNMIGNVPSAPHLMDAAIDLLTQFPVPAPAIDPVGNAWNLLSQGQAEAAVRLMGVKWLYPETPRAWEALVREARSQADELAEVLKDVRAVSTDVHAAGQEAKTAIATTRAELETKAKQAGLLLSTVGAETANALYEAEAKRYEGESKTAWGWGVGTLVAAACAAVAPLVLHYAGVGPEYTGAGLLAAHAGTSAALGAVSGVLLARARGRDRAAQRSRDLSTAMGTMISYSNQIADDASRQQFMLTMGQLVLQAHLQGDATPKDDSLTGLAALLSVMRPQTPTSAA